MLNITEQFKALSSGLFQGGEYETLRGDHRVAARWSPWVKGVPLRVEARSAEWGGVWGPSPEILKFETQFGAFWQEIDVFPLFTFVNENIVIVLDSGIDMVAYYFNFLVVWMPSVSCCSGKLAYSGRVSWSSKQVHPWRG